MSYLITGGGSGIGQALAKKLANRGESVLIVGRRKHKLEETRAFAENQIVSLEADLKTDDGLNRVEQWVGEHGALKAVVQNAAVIDPITPLMEMSRDSWHDAFRINVDAPLFLLQRLQRYLENGRVLHISTAAAHEAFRNWGAYCTTKAALYMMYRCFKNELPNIAFGSVMPGITDTDMQGLIRGSAQMDVSDKAFFQSLKEEGKLLSVDVVADFLCWLLLDIDEQRFSANEWDIYALSHHHEWLKEGHVPKVFDNE